MAVIKGKNSGLWALELSEDRLRLVHISPRRGGCELDHAVRIELEPASSDEHIAELIGRAIDSSGLGSRMIALCLPGSDGDILPATAADSDETGDDFASTIINYGNGRSMVARGRISTARRFVKIASLAGLQPQCVLPMQAALAVSGDIFTTPGRKSRQSDGQTSVAVFVGTTRIIMMLVRDQMVQRCRVAPRSFTTDRYDHDVRGAIRQFFAAISTAGGSDNGSWPVSCDIFADGLGAEELRYLSDSVGVSCRSCTPAMSRNMSVAGEYASSVASYSATIGACLNALGLAEVKIDLIDEVLAASHRRDPAMGRGRLWSAVLAVFVVFAVGALGYVRIKKKIEFERLENQYQQIQPLLDRASQIESQWSRLQPWLSADKFGKRPRQMDILKTIVELFPDPTMAYVTDMQVDFKSEGDMAIDIKGRSAGSEVLHEYVSRLNESGRFQALLGTVSDIEQSRDYPKKYSITITLTKQAEDAGKP